MRGRLEDRPFAYQARADGTVAVTYRGRPATTLRGNAATRFLARGERGGRRHGPARDGQGDRQLQARERAARDVIPVSPLVLGGAGGSPAARPGPGARPP